MAQCFTKRTDTVACTSLSSKYESNKPDKNGMTSVNRAVAFGDLIALDRMLARGCPDLNVGDNDGNTPLIYAVSLGHHLVVMRLLRSKNIDVDKRNNCGITALMKAAIHNHGACVDLLLKAGANIDLTDHSRCMTALQWAKHCGSQQCIKILHKHSKRLAKTKPDQCRYVRSTSDLTLDKSSAVVTHKRPNILINRIKHSLGLPSKQHQSRSNESLLTLSGVVACSASAIPMLLGVSQDDSGYAVGIPLTMTPTFTRKKPQTKFIPSLPIILITKDSGEVVEAESVKNKPSRHKSHNRKNSTNNNYKPPPAPNKISVK